MKTTTRRQPRGRLAGWVIVCLTLASILSILLVFLAPNVLGLRTSLPASPDQQQVVDR